MKTYGKVILAAILLTLTACSGSSNSNDTGNDSENQFKKTVTVNGKSPRDYFDQFLYRRSGTCEKRQDIRWHYLRSDEITLGEGANNLPRYALVEIYLLNENRYYLKYSEMEVVLLNYRERGAVSTYRNSLEGSYRITENGHIVFENFGTGMALNDNGEEAILFNITSDTYPAVTGKFTSLKMIKSSMSEVPGEASIQEVCGSRP